MSGHAWKPMKPVYCNGNEGLVKSAASSDRLLIQLTVPVSFGFFTNQLRWLQARGFDVHTVSADGDSLGAFASQEGITAHAIPTHRNIAPLADLVSLARTVRLYRHLRPDIVHGFTPKGGLLAMLAAWLTRRPVRIYTIFGFVYMNSFGLRKQILKLTERLACALAHRVYCECESIRDVAVQERICPESKIRVLSAWNFNGLKVIKERSQYAERYRSDIRNGLGIPETSTVIGFVGRIVPEKGIAELLAAHATLRESFPDLRLLLVGYTEREHPLPSHLASQLSNMPNVHWVGLQRDVVPYLASMDILAHPSYREGLPTAPLEAAAMGLPVVVTNIPGCIDAVQAGVNGLLVPACDSKALAEALRWLVSNPSELQRFGQAGRAWADTLIRQPTWETLAAGYREMLGSESSASRLRSTAC